MSIVEKVGVITKLKTDRQPDLIQMRRLIISATSTLLAEDFGLVCRDESFFFFFFLCVCVCFFF